MRAQTSTQTRVGTTTTSVGLPPEIWLNIAQHLPSDSLQRLSTLNHALYEAAMDDRYSRMHLGAFGANIIRNMILIKYVQRFKCAVYWWLTRLFDNLRYPYIARRVRFFEISPFAVEDLANLRSTSPSSLNSLKRSFEESLFRLLRPLWSAKKIQDQMHPERESTESMTQFVMESIKGFVNVEEYAINWGGCNPFPFDIALINAGWPVFGKNLRWISISYPLDRFSAIFPPPIDLRNLHTLEMECFIFLPRKVKANSEDTTPLLKVLASSLRSITAIRSFRLTEHMWARFDVSPFFRALQVFPCLQAFYIDVPFERECLADPSALADFINGHRLTLQHLTLLPSHPRSLMIMQDEVFCQMVSHLLSINLLSLELCTNLLSVDSVVKCIEPFSHTLTSLFLLWQGLVYNQIQIILATFLHRAPHNRLTVLSIGVSEVTPEVLDLFADNLPSLKKLCIEATVIDQENSKFYNTTRVYKEWKDLISLWIGRIGSRLAAWSLMIYLADHCIPTIQECDGHPFWKERCECAILKIDSLRDALTNSDCLRLDYGDSDDAIARRFQIAPYACDSHLYYPPKKSAY